MFDSPESPALWFNIFNGVLFTGALLVAVGTWGTIKTAGIKERFSDERIAANEAETKRAVADSDAAKEGTVRAAERIAELSTQAEQLRKDTAEANARAAKAQLALAKFRAPRRFDESQVVRIKAAIEHFPGTPFDISVNLEPMRGGHAYTPARLQEWCCDSIFIEHRASVRRCRCAS